MRYVLESSLRKADNRIRVTAQLVEAETGKRVWAEQYDRDLAGIFAVQDEITEAVTIAIAQPSPRRSSSARCGSRRGTSTLGPLISAGCGMWARLPSRITRRSRRMQRA